MARAAISVRSSASPTLNWVGRDVVAVLGRQSFPQGAARRTGRAPLEPTRRRAVAAGCGCGRGADGGQTTACPPGLRCRNLVTLAASTAARTHGGPERRSVAHAEPVEDLNA